MLFTIATFPIAIQQSALKDILETNGPLPLAEAPEGDCAFTVAISEVPSGRAECDSKDVFEGMTVFHAGPVDIFRIDSVEYSIDWQKRLLLISADGFKAETGYRTVLRGFKLLFSFLAVSKGGVLIHSSAAATGGSGMLFTGKSGSGKSTIHSLLKACGWQALNDEWNIILPCEGNVCMVYPTPFNIRNDAFAAMSAHRLDSIFYLKQGTRNGVEFLSTPQHIRSLSGNVRAYADSNKTGDRLLQNVCAIPKAVKGGILTFAKTPEIGGFLYALGEEKKYLG
jgi:hypothetical protein